MSHEMLSNLQRIPVITQDSGKDIGSVTHVYVDEQAKQLSALGFKYQRTKEEAYVDNAAITLVGQDVVLIDSEMSVVPMPDAESPEGLGRQIAQAPRYARHDAQWQTPGRYRRLRHQPA